MTGPSPLELTGGRWVKQGAIRVWVEDDPDTTPDETATILLGVLERITWLQQPVTGVLCHCGCLLANTSETCPACLVWAERDAEKARQRQQERINRRGWWTKTKRKAA